MKDWTLGRITLFTKYPEVLLDFYVSVLGFQIAFRDESRSMIEIQTDQLVLSIQKKMVGSSPVCFSILCEDSKVTLKHFRNTNIPAGPLKVLHNRIYFEVKDPDGNVISFESTQLK